MMSRDTEIQWLEACYEVDTATDYRSGTELEVFHDREAPAMEMARLMSEHMLTCEIVENLIAVWQEHTITGLVFLDGHKRIAARNVLYHSRHTQFVKYRTFVSEYGNVPHGARNVVYPVV
jgi:hypothetical protein